MRTRRLSSLQWVFALAFAFGLGVGAHAQYWWPCMGEGTPVSNDFLETGWTNGIIQIVLGATGTTAWGNDAVDETPPDMNDWPEEGCFSPGFTVPSTGRFSFGMDKGSVLTTLDDQCAISMGWPYAAGDFCYATIRTTTANSNEIFGADNSRWQLGPYYGASGAYIRGVYLCTNAAILVDCRVDVLGDTWRFRWNFFNQSTGTDAGPVPVGMRFGQWTAFRQANPNSYSGMGDPMGFLQNLYVLVPGHRPLQTDLIADKTALGSVNMPPFCDFYFTQSTPYPNFRQWMKPDLQHQDLTQIDRFEFMDWGRLLFANLWTGRTIPDFPVTDPCYAVFYNPVNIRVQPTSDFPDKPGHQIIQYMSIATTSSDVSGPMAVATETYPALAYDSSNLNGIRPNPFSVYAWVQNNFVTPDASTDLTNIAVTLSLPKGLTFAPNQDPVQHIAMLQPGEVQSVQWSVQADGTVSGTVPYRVLCTAKEITAAKTVTNQLLVPSTPKVKAAPGWNMVGIPFDFKDTQIKDIFGFKPRSLQYDPNTNDYVPWDTTKRGLGFWLNTGGTGTYDLAGATAPVGQTTQTYATTELPGWQIVTNPWQFPISLGQATVIGGNDQVLTWQQAVQSGWIHGVMYYWDTDLQQYQWTQDFGTPLEPLRGYWIKVLAPRSVQLVWPPVFAAGVGNPPTRSSVDAWAPRHNRFRLQLSARASGGSDTQTYFAVAPDASEQIDQYDVAKAPIAPDTKVRVAIDHSDWGVNAGPYAQDTRPSSNRNETWEFAVTSFQDGDVTLTWPTISKLPKDFTFRVTDEQSGAARNLRSVSAYTYHGTTGVRKFKLELLPATPAKVLISGLNVSHSRGAAVTVQYSLNVSATTTMRVLNARGKLVREIGPTDQTPGLQTRMWDTRDMNNVSLPPGTYMIEVRAVTQDGQVARVVRPQVLTR